MRKSWKKSSLIFGAVSIALLMILSATAVSQTHGAIAIKKLSQVQRINSIKKKILESKIANQKPFTKLFSKIKQLLNNETFKKQISKIRVLLQQKYGENFLKNINIESLKEKIEKSLPPSKLREIKEKLSSLTNALQDKPEPTLIVDGILGILLIVLSIIPWLGAAGCYLIYSVCFGLLIGLMYGSVIPFPPPPLLGLILWVIAILLIFFTTVSGLATATWFCIAVMLDAIGVFLILPP